MNISIHIDSESTAVELVALANFSKELALGRGAHVTSGSVQLTAPVDPAELDEGEAVVVGGTEAPKRRRRTKDEIAAAAAAAPGTTVPTTDTDPHQTTVENAAEKATATAEDAAGNVQPASTPTAASTEAATTTPATASPSDDGKEYTEAEVQDLAGKVARTIGPEVVKGKIAELGAARIADLTQGQRNDLGRFLVSKLP